jgi:hypothetical protein
MVSPHLTTREDILMDLLAGLSLCSTGPARSRELRIRYDILLQIEVVEQLKIGV